MEALMLTDAIWHKVRTEIALENKDAVIVHIPEEEEDVVYACTDMHNGSWRDLRFDRYSGELLPNTAKPMRDAKAAEWISRSNFGLHTGFIGGLTTKILYFVASLICATLPVTGLYVWWYKRKKKPISVKRASKKLAAV